MLVVEKNIFFKRERERDRERKRERERRRERERKRDRDRDREIEREIEKEIEREGERERERQRERERERERESEREREKEKDFNEISHKLTSWLTWRLSFSFQSFKSTGVFSDGGFSTAGSGAPVSSGSSSPSPLVLSAALACPSPFASPVLGISFLSAFLAVCFAFDLPLVTLVFAFPFPRGFLVAGSALSRSSSSPDPSSSSPFARLRALAAARTCVQRAI